MTLIQVAIFGLLLFVEGGGHVHPIAFQKNTGQARADIGYLLRRDDYQVDFKRGEVVLHADSRSLRIYFTGGLSKPSPSGYSRLDGQVRYIGSSEAEPKNTGPMFASVRYESLYPGVDLVFYGRLRLSADLIIAPGADQQKFCAAIEGADRVEIEKAGSLAIFAGNQTLHIPRPNAFQVSSAGRRPVDVRYEISDSHEIRLSFSQYDPALPLITSLL